MELVLSFALFGLCTVAVNGHGRLVEPPSRNSMWRYGFSNPPNYSDNQLNCGGFSFQWNNNGGKCGVCGDPYGKSQPHVFPGKYANNIITRTYKQGQIVNVKVQITANHKGYFTFKVGNIGTPPITEEKLNHLLKIAGTTGTRYYLPEGSKSGFFDVALQLPASLICAHCVFRWWYTAGNSWGTGATGSGVGKGAQETFVNCADVRIVSNGGVTQPDMRTKPSTKKPITSTAQKATLPQTIIQTTTARPKPVPSTIRPTMPTIPGDKCKATGRYASIGAYDWWCKMNCPVNCPKSHCICTSTTNPRLPKPKICRAAGAYTSVAGMDTWCRQNCPAFCPKTHCMCS